MEKRASKGAELKLVCSDFSHEGLTWDSEAHALQSVVLMFWSPLHYDQLIEGPAVNTTCSA